MWICRCGKKNVDSEDSCWNCGVERAAAERTEDQELQPKTKEPAEQETDTDTTPTYRTARIIAQLVSFVGWVSVVIGALGFLFFLAMDLVSRRVPDFVGLLWCLGGVVGGLLLVLAGQFIRATIDTAENTGEMLSMMKKRKSK